MASLSTVIQKMTVPMLAKHVVRTVLTDSYFLEPLSDSLFPYLNMAYYCLLIKEMSSACPRVRRLGQPGGL